LSSSVVIGLAPFLDVAWHAWRAVAPELAIRRLEAHQGADYVFAADCLTAIEPADAVFVAIDDRFLNFKRLELVDLVRARGNSLASVIGRGAVIADDVVVGANAFVGEGAVIGPGATIGDGACIGARAVVGAAAVVGPAVWLEPAVVVGGGARIGEQTTIASGVVVGAGAEIGELCVLAIPGLVRGRVSARTFHHPSFHEPIRVFR
jgi:UDP-3-O-[3-hydroxymyristoyl] glucosamine N-acyltransferase